MKASAPSFRQLPDSPVVVVACPNLAGKITGYLTSEILVECFDPLELWLDKRCLCSIKIPTPSLVVVEWDRMLQCTFAMQNLRAMYPTTPILACVPHLPNEVVVTRWAYHQGVVFFPTKKYAPDEAKIAFQQALQLAEIFAIV